MRDVRAGAKVGELAVSIKGDDFAVRDVLDDIELEFRRLATGSEEGKFAALGEFDRFVARDLDTLEAVVGLDLLLHLLLDASESPPA